MSQPTTTAVELLGSFASIISNIVTNLNKNRLDRGKIKQTLTEYSARAESDGRLINASRQNERCIDHGLFLAFVHMEFVTTLLRYNFTLPATSVKWYRLKSLRKKYRLSLLSISSQTADLQDQLRNIRNKAEMLYADLEVNNVQVPPTPIQYNRVAPCTLLAAPPGTFSELLHRGSIAEKELSGKMSV
ncbi:glyoxalase family protein [Aspergillus heteromorphus CBS 117.55]|uniref:Glyoxalase family protein n=1 Tax=Aspergillus heteromorphus CBS 117.55 TaxID=1448321 RepID=A0A317VHT6_9EURO|nr:glyoxalase family protein [Aspergillus heteromorphus CBS 117.55]PWY73019.1 glyoxalase family protein [Aspergillus heteromorphus CBS 117.55]